MNLTELDGAARLSVASLIGFAVGLEREWSGHAAGPQARFAGLRTFLLIAVLGGVAGLFMSRAAMAPATALLAGGAVICLVAYAAAAWRPAYDLDATTEIAGVVVLALACLAGVGWLRVSSAAGAIVLLALSEKRRLHAVVNAIGAPELQAGLQFSVLAVVVLPLLPEGPFGGALAIRPRALWGVVLAFCALNFASYVARRAIGANHGYGIAGALGGLLSSTAVTITYSRRSRSDDDDAASLATGVIAACSVLILRILVISTVLDPAVALAALPYLAPALVVVGLMYRHGALPAPAEQLRDKNPLRFTAALEMAVAFQLALSVIAILRPRLGKFGLYGVSVALGLTDMDALTLSVSSKSSMIEPDVAARALAIGVVANTTFKLAIALAIGRSRFRRRTGAGLATMAVATALALLVV